MPLVPLAKNGTAVQCGMQRERACLVAVFLARLVRKQRSARAFAANCAQMNVQAEHALQQGNLAAE